MQKRAKVYGLGLLGFAPSVLAFLRISDTSVKYGVLISAAVSLIGFLATVRVIPVLKPSLLKANLSGLDINKKGDIPASAIISLR